MNTFSDHFLYSSEINIIELIQALLCDGFLALVLKVVSVQVVHHSFNELGEEAEISVTFDEGL